MPFYVLLSKLTAEGRKTVKENPERIKEVNREVEALGVRILHQFATLGPYDFVNIIEAPSNEVIYKASAEFGSRGTVKILSMPAVTVDMFIDNLKSKR